MNNGLKSEDVLEKDQIIQLGYPPNRIDILTTLKEITFVECYQVKVVVDIVVFVNNNFDNKIKT